MQWRVRDEHEAIKRQAHAQGTLMAMTRKFAVTQQQQQRRRRQQQNNLNKPPGFREAAAWQHGVLLHCCQHFSR
jgi:hypothetical protein